jgi:hypothetical protein
MSKKGAIKRALYVAKKRHGYADGGFPMSLQDWAAFSPFQQPSMTNIPPLSQHQFYNGVESPLNPVKEKPAAVQSDQTDLVATHQPIYQGGAGEGGATQSMGGVGPDITGGAVNNTTNETTDESTEGGKGSFGSTLGGFGAGLAGGLLGTAIAGPIGGIVGGMLGRGAFNAMNDKDDEETDSEDDSEGDDDGGNDGGDDGGGDDGGGNDGGGDGTGGGDSGGSGGDSGGGDGGGGGGGDGGGGEKRGGFIVDHALHLTRKRRHHYADGGPLTPRALAESWTPPEDVDPRLGQFLQEYPSKMADAIVDTVSYPHDIHTGEKSLYTFDPETGEKRISDEAIKKALDLSGAAMTGGVGGATASAGQAVLGSGPIRKLMQNVANERGAEMARRVERAADEIPNLDRLYTERALRNAFTENDRLLMTMKPSDFLKAASPLAVSPKASYVGELADIARSGGFSDVPWLQVRELPGLPVSPHFISGHEGRHRSLALDAIGQPTSLVQLAPHPAMKEKIKDLIEERHGYVNPYDNMRFMKGIREQLPEDMRLVPQSKTLEESQKMQFPEPYKKGGSIVGKALMLTSKKAASRRGRPK